MTSSAVYRYFPSREQLLTDLVCDGFASLADALHTAEQRLEADGQDWADRWMGLARAYRSWALDHPSEFTLMFGSPLPEMEDPDGREAEVKACFAVLLRLVLAGIQAGRLDLTRLDGTIGAELRSQLRRWPAGRLLPGGLRPEALAAALLAWVQLQGIITLELFGHLPAAVLPADQLFDQQVRALLAAFEDPLER